MTSTYAFKQVCSTPQLTPLLNVCVSHIHFFNPHRVNISKGVNLSERSEEGEGGHTKPRISVILAATQILYYFTPRPIPLLSPLSPLPSAVKGRWKGRGLKPPPAASWKSSSCHLPSRVRMAHFCRILFGPRGRCGAWVRGAPGTLAPPKSRSREALHCGCRCAGYLGWAAVAPAPRPPAPSWPPPAGGIQSLPVAKGGEKANVEVPGTPRRYWNRAWGSSKRSSAFSPAGPRCGRKPRLLLCCSGVQVPQNL